MKLWRRVREPLMTCLFWASGLSVAAVFAAIFGHLLLRGWEGISWDYFLRLPARAGREGGIASVLVGTLLILGTAMAVALPLAVGCAVYLSEWTRWDSRSGRLARRSLDILAGVPSIVFGLFGLAFFCEFLGWGWSILSGGLTLACMALPLLTRASEEALRSVPQDYRLACESLGVGRGAALWRILLPSAAPGIMGGLALGLGRALAETAAVMYTAGASLRMPDSLLASSRSLSYHIYLLSVEVPGGASRAYTAALVLILLLLAVNGLAHFLSIRFLGRRVYR